MNSNQPRRRDGAKEDAKKKEERGTMAGMSSFLDITAWNSLEERWRSVGWDGLNPVERELLSIEFVVARTSNAGLGAALSDLPVEWPMAIAGMGRIGASQLGDLLLRVAAAGPGLDDTAIGLFETEFWSLYETVDLNALVEGFVDSNAAQFPGPRTLEELWQSQQARGIKEPPRKLVKFQKAAVTDRNTAQPVCTRCGQSLPTYRKTCRRCGQPMRQHKKNDPSL